MDQIITQNATIIIICHVHASAHILYKILAVGGDKSTLLCSVDKDSYWIPVESQHIIAAVRAKQRRSN